MNWLPQPAQPGPIKGFKKGYLGGGNDPGKHTGPPPICFNCGVEGHFVSECPAPKKPSLSGVTPFSTNPGQPGSLPQWHGQMSSGMSHQAAHASQYGANPGQQILGQPMPGPNPAFQARYAHGIQPATAPFQQVVNGSPYGPPFINHQNHFQGAAQGRQFAQVPHPFAHGPTGQQWQHGQTVNPTHQQHMHHPQGQFGQSPYALNNSQMMPPFQAQSGFPQHQLHHQQPQPHSRHASFAGAPGSQIGMSLIQAGSPPTNGAQWHGAGGGQPSYGSARHPQTSHFPAQQQHSQHGFQSQPMSYPPNAPPTPQTTPNVGHFPWSTRSASSQVPFDPGQSQHSRPASQSFAPGNLPPQHGQWSQPQNLQHMSSDGPSLNHEMPNTGSLPKPPHHSPSSSTYQSPASNIVNGIAAQSAIGSHNPDAISMSRQSSGASTPYASYGIEPVGAWGEQPTPRRDVEKRSKTRSDNEEDFNWAFKKIFKESILQQPAALAQPLSSQFSVTPVPLIGTPSKNSVSRHARNDNERDFTQSVRKAPQWPYLKQDPIFKDLEEEEILIPIRDVQTWMEARHGSSAVPLHTRRASGSRRKRARSSSEQHDIEHQLQAEVSQQVKRQKLDADDATEEHMRAKTPLFEMANTQQQESNHDVWLPQPGDIAAVNAMAAKTSPTATRMTLASSAVRGKAATSAAGRLNSLQHHGHQTYDGSVHVGSTKTNGLSPGRHNSSMGSKQLVLSVEASEPLRHEMPFGKEPRQSNDPPSREETPLSPTSREILGELVEPVKKRRIVRVISGRRGAPAIEDAYSRRW